MNNDFFFQIAAAEHLGYIRGAIQARAQRIKNGTPTLRDRVQRLANRSGAYLVGSSALGCYKFGYGVSLRNGIGSHDRYPFKLDVIMWWETDDGRELTELLRDLFLSKFCKVKDTSGEWFKLDDADLETLRTKFQFISN